MSRHRIIGSALVLATLSTGAGPAHAQFIQRLPAPTPDADALAASMRRLGANPRDLDALVTAGELSLKLDDMNAAASFLARAEKLDPMSGRVKAAMATLLVRNERPGEALRYFNQAEGYGYAARSFAADRALAYDLIGQQERAQRDYRVALKQRTDDETIRRYALSLGISGQRDRALEQIDTLLRKSDRGAWRARAFILAMNGDVSGASKIATSMMPGGNAALMQPFFVMLPTLAATDRAFAVHFGEVRSTPARLADARLTPALATLGPEPGVAPVAVAAVQATAKPSRADRRRARDRDRDRRGGRSRGRLDRIEVASAAPVVAALPAPPALRTVQRLPTPAYAAAGTARYAYRAPIAAAPARTSALAPGATGTVRDAYPVTVASAPAGGPVVQPGRVAPVGATRSLPGAITFAPSSAGSTTGYVRAAPPTQSEPFPTVMASAAIPAPLSIARSSASPFVTLPPATGFTPAVTAASPIQIAPVAFAARSTVPGSAPAPGFSSLSNAPAALAYAPPAASPRVVAAAPVPVARPFVATMPMPTRLSEDTILARIIAGIAVPASELDVAPPVARATLPAARVAAAAPGKATPIVDPAAIERAARDRKALAAKTVADRKALATKTAADKKALAAKTEAAAKKALADKAAAEEKRLAKLDPPRIWVQVAGGATEGDLPRAWSAARAKAPALTGRQAYSTPLRATNRVVTGPFKTDAEAQAFVNQLAKQGVSGFTFTSAKGQKMTKLPPR